MVDNGPFRYLRLGYIMNDQALPDSIAIAGAWGYIGLKFVEAAIQLGITPRVYDPGPRPYSVDPASLRLFADENAFYRCPAPFFHLALHPKDRQRALATLFERARRGDDLVILNEKPMAAPENPDHCNKILRRVEESGVFLMYDFLELFDPMTQAIDEFLAGMADVIIDEIWMHRSKDRESPDNARNYKIMVPIQYQETVHCIAFVLSLLGKLHGGLQSLWAGGASMLGVSEPYAPPNPEEYPYVVDGKCDGELLLGGVKVHLHTNFKTGAEFTKRRLIKGRANGKPFVIEADYLEGNKYLLINGEDQDIDPESDSYVGVIRQLWHWRQNVDKEALMAGVYPNARFAKCTYLLSAMLWDSCRHGETVSVDDLDHFLAYRPSFPAELPDLERYASA